MPQPTDVRLVTEAKLNSGQAVQDGRLALLEGAAGFTAPPLGFQDEIVEALVANSASGTSGVLGGRFVTRGEVIVGPAPTGGDDTALLNTLLDAYAGKKITLRPSATYKITSQLNIRSGTTLDMNRSTIDASGIPDGVTIRERFAFIGEGSIGSSITASAAITKWSRTITGLASTTGLAAGDLIRIRNFENPGPGGTKTNVDKGELNVIASVDSATQITLAYGTIFDYANDGALVIAKLNPVKDIEVTNGALIMGGVLSAHTGLSFRYARNINVTDIEVVGAEDTGVHFAHTWRGHVQGGHIADSTSPAVGVGTTGYGVTFEDCSRFMQVNEVQFYNCRSFVNGGGVFPASNVDIMWNHGRKASTIGYGAHEPCYYWKFSNNTVIGGGGGIQFRGQHGTVEHNTILDCPGNGVRFYSDEGITAQDGITVRGNHLDKCGSGIVIDGMVVNTTAVESIKRGVKIENNRIFNSTFDAILLKNFDAANIHGNLIDGALNNGINATGVSAVNPSKNLSIANNQIKNVTLVGIKAKWVNDIDLEIGTIDTTGQQGILLDTCVGTNTSGGSIRRATTNGIRIINGSQHVVRPGTIKDMVGATADAIAGVTANDFSVLGGITTGVRYGVYLSGCDKAIVSGVNADASTGVGGVKIRIETMTTYRLSANIGTSIPAS